MRVIRSVLALALLAAATVPAAGQTQGKFKFTSGTPYPTQPTLYVPSSVASKTGWFYTSIYRGQFLAGVPGNPVVDIFCVDFFHNANTSSSGYDVWLTPLSAGDYSHTYGVDQRGWNPGIAEERYRAAAWLATQFSPADPNKTANWRKYQAAIWSLMGQTSTNFEGDGTVGLASAFDLNGYDDPFESSAETALQEALDNAGSIDGDDWTIISAASGNYQEFMVQQSVVPEPETVILLLTGLLAVGAVAYFRGLSA
jgi:hypothetical protein